MTRYSQCTGTGRPSQGSSRFAGTGTEGYAPSSQPDRSQGRQFVLRTYPDGGTCYTSPTDYWKRALDHATDFYSANLQLPLAQESFSATLKHFKQDLWRILGPGGEESARGSEFFERVKQEISKLDTLQAAATDYFESAPRDEKSKTSRYRIDDNTTSQFKSGFEELLKIYEQGESKLGHPGAFQ